MTKKTINVKKNTKPTSSKKTNKVSSKSTSSRKVSKVSTKSSKTLKKTPIKKVDSADIKNSIFKKINPRIALVVIFLCAVLLIFASYAWFSTNLNIKVKTLSVVVAKTSDLTISIDGVNFARSIEIDKEILYDNLSDIYPNNTTLWPSNGLIPVSSPGVLESNPDEFTMFESTGVLYLKRDPERGFIKTKVSKDYYIREYSYYLAFDIFIKNINGSPSPDNLFFDETTSIYAPGDIDEEVQGLINSFRIGVVKLGSVPLNATVEEIQNITCEKDCEFAIYEPNSKFHTPLSIERAKKYNVILEDGHTFPTYAYIKAGGPIYVENSISGSSRIDREYFTVQETLTDDEVSTNEIFKIPDGITKARVYVWIEGQDIDSLETESKGTNIDLGLNFIKDTEGWDIYIDK